MAIKNEPTTKLPTYIAIFRKYKIRDSRCVETANAAYKKKKKKLKACQMKHVKVENDANARASEFHFQEF